MYSKSFITHLDSFIQDLCRPIISTVDTWLNHVDICELGVMFSQLGDNIRVGGNRVPHSHIWILEKVSWMSGSV
jgi:hypothetical protein